MTSKAQNWGNSLARRITRAVAEDIGLVEPSEIDPSPSDGTLVPKPIRAAEPTLDELLAQITDESVHAEILTGSAVGKEQW